MLWSKRPQPVYVVAGHRRSGTTMLMQALEAGGMRVARAPQGDPMHDFYELSTEQRAGDYWEQPYETRFPFQYRGKLIKCLTGTARYVAEQEPGIIVAFMRRDPAAIAASDLDAFGNASIPEMVEQRVQEEMAIWRGIEHVRFIPVWYGDVLRDPVRELEQLRASGFPIRNIARAARLVDPDRRRFTDGVARASS